MSEISSDGSQPKITIFSESASSKPTASRSRSQSVSTRKPTKRLSFLNNELSLKNDQSDEKEEIESTTTETQTLGIPVKMERRKSLMRLIGEGISASIQDSTIFKSGSFSNKDKLEKKIQASASVSSRLSDSADEKRSSITSIGMSISSVLKIKGDEKDETEYLKDKQEYERNKNEMKVLVLGTSGSGKTTFINQIRRINGYTFTPVELQHAKSNQLYHILSILELVLFGCDDEVQQEYTQILSFVSQQPKPYLEIPSHVQKSIKRMWNDLKLKDHFNRLKIPNLDYFLDRIELIGQLDYVLQNDDLIRIKSNTSGITESIMKIQSQSFNLISMPISLNLKKQIVKYFDDTISIVFLVSLISISSLLGVGSNTCLDETLGLFRYLIHHRLIEQQSVVLIFNQYDLFVSSYSALEFQGNFPDFHSDISDPQIAVDYLKDLFMKELNETHRVVQVYVTSSIDTQKIESINSDLTSLWTTKISH